MIKFIAIPVVVLITIIVGLSWYLQPDDINKCKLPNGTKNCQPVDAIIAISGGDTESRANYAIKLYKDGWSDKLIFSGAALDKTGPSNAAVMQSMAVKAGIPKSNIFIDEASETTKQNAVNANTIFKQHNLKRVILVTSGYHQRRAGLEFSKRAGDTVILNGPVRIDRNWSFWWWTSLSGWWLALSEVVKILIFFAVGSL